MPSTHMLNIHFWVLVLSDEHVMFVLAFRMPNQNHASCYHEDVGCKGLIWQKTRMKQKLVVVEARNIKRQRWQKSNQYHQVHSNNKESVRQMPWAKPNLVTQCGLIWSKVLSNHVQTVQPVKSKKNKVEVVCTVIAAMWSQKANDKFVHQVTCHATFQIHGKRVLNLGNWIVNVLVSCQHMAKVTMTKRNITNHLNEMSQVKQWQTRRSNKMQKRSPLRGQKTSTLKMSMHATN